MGGIKDKFKWLLITLSLVLFFFICYKWPLFYIIEHTKNTMPYLYLIQYIIFPLIPCLTKFILVNLRNSGKGSSLYDLILIYILSFICMIFFGYLICITVFLLPEILEFCSWAKIRELILPKPILLDSIDGWELFTPPARTPGERVYAYNFSDGVNNFVTAARDIAREWNSIFFAISELDLKKPHPSGTTRLSAFDTHLLNLKQEAIRLDLLARRRHYRNIIMNTPSFTRNDSSDVDFSDFSSDVDFSDSSSDVD